MARSVRMHGPRHRRIDSFTRVLASRVYELRHRNVPTSRQAASMAFDPIDFVESRCGKVRGSAVWTADHWDLLDHEQTRPFAVAARHGAVLDTFPATVLADKLFTVRCHIQSGGTASSRKRQTSPRRRSYGH
jgi:hypothetical protein